LKQSVIGKGKFRQEAGGEASDHRDPDVDMERRAAEISVTGSRFWQISPDLLGVLKADGYFGSCNPAWGAALGWSEDEVRSMSIFELLHPEDRERTRDGFEHLKRGNPILRFENRYQRKDGGYNWFAWAAAPLGSDYYCCGRDISYEKEQGISLEAARAERDSVWRNSRDLLVIVGVDGLFRNVNPAWTDILGYAHEELVGHSFLDFVLPEDADLTRGGLDAAVTERDLTYFENRYRHKDGSLRWISWRTAMEGDLVFSYGRDITATKAAQAELAQAQDALRQSQKMEAIGQLTGGVAHDFNNLLTIIRSAADLLRRDSLPEDRRRRYVDAISDTADRAAKLTGQLLSFARRQALVPRVFDVADQLEHLVDMLKSVLGSRIELRLALRERPVPVEADVSQFETALVNLAANARDAMEGEGQLVITLEGITEKGGAKLITISVSDTGCGIPVDKLGQVFEPFFTTKEVGHGTGLGLSQVHGFAQQSGGGITVDSVEGRGATFTLFLPRTTKELASVEPRDGRIFDARRNRYILVVEDNTEVGEFSMQLLNDLGYHTTLASDAQSALKLLGERPGQFDLVFSDVVMPGMDGVALGREIRRRFPALPIVLASGYSHVLAEDVTHKFPILHKPYSVENLSKMLRAMTSPRGRDSQDA
jgi:PAS domain S-box-containing protein